MRIRDYAAEKVLSNWRIRRRLPRLTSYAFQQIENFEIVPARPLPRGTIIDYCGEKATVIEDAGASTLKVEVLGNDEQNWKWELENIKCTVVGFARGF